MRKVTCDLILQTRTCHEDVHSDYVIFILYWGFIIYVACTNDKLNHVRVLSSQDNILTRLIKLCIIREFRLASWHGKKYSIGLRAIDVTGKSTARNILWAICETNNSTILSLLWMK